MVKGMRPGSVVVDLAAESGGNVELTRPAEVVETGGVFIDGTRNVPSTIPVHASQLYSRNVANLLLSVAREGQVNLDFDDEVIKGSVVTHAGEIVNERAREMVEAASLGVPA
jgi:NAD(P) transhydrogenase subunit alpha